MQDNGPAPADDPAFVDMSAYVQKLIEESGETDQRTRLLLHLLQQRNAAAEDEPEDDTPSMPTAADRTARLGEEARQRVKAMVRSYPQIVAERDDLRRLADSISRALGACPQCFGTEPQCAGCHGEGAPGSYVPDFYLFRLLVEPAVRRLRDFSRGSNGGGSQAVPNQAFNSNEQERTVS